MSRAVSSKSKMFRPGTAQAVDEWNTNRHWPRYQRLHAVSRWISGLPSDSMPLSGAAPFHAALTAHSPPSCPACHTAIFLPCFRTVEL